MGLFKCRICGMIENTALSMCSWSQMDNPLCSECCPAQKKWHGRFEKTCEMPEGEKDTFLENE